ARFAGEDASDQENLRKLLRLVGADDDRRVAYVCALVYAEPDGFDQRFEEYCRGTLAAEPRGSGGFGYDPAFVPDDVGDGRTMAELAAAEKDAVSQRGRAGRMLAEGLEAARAPARGRGRTPAPARRRPARRSPAPPWTAG